MQPRVEIPAPLPPILAAQALTALADSGEERRPVMLCEYSHSMGNRCVNTHATATMRTVHPAELLMTLALGGPLSVHPRPAKAPVLCCLSNA